MRPEIEEIDLVAIGFAIRWQSPAILHRVAIGFAIRWQSPAIFLASFTKGIVIVFESYF